MVDAEDLVVDNSLDEVEHPPANEQQAKVAPPRRREAAALPRLPGRQRADQHNTQVEVWKSPSASVLSSRPCTVFIGKSPSSVSRWCH